MATSWTTIGTTLPCVPLPPNSEREPIRTERLLIRPLQEDDLQDYYVLRTQPEVMLGTKRGVPDRDIEESRTVLKAFLPGNEHKSFYFGAFLASTGEYIGEGGIHTMESFWSGWPEIGYKFKREYWGQGYTTEFMRGVLEAWWKLPRQHVKARIDSTSVEETSEGEATEQVYAKVVVDNLGSRKVLEKLGFTHFSEWIEPDTHLHRLGQPVTLVGYRVPALRFSKAQEEN
ncbi:acyl-CoA N-acyltransferase [Hypomontagnella submonticulosa]|nr:acyl-CoA N-acyltransferase [Hypomontagnella submonticulosa]